MATTKAPATKTYRVAQLGVIYTRLVEDYGPDGQDTLVPTREVATFGQHVELTDREAQRLKKIGDELDPPRDLIKPKDAPLTYDEMDDPALAKLAEERGIRVTSSGADADKPLRTDYITALTTYDQGQGGQQPAVPVSAS